MTVASVVIPQGCLSWSTCGAGRGTCHPITQAQQNAVITMPATATAAAKYIWTGDRWQSGWNGTGAPRPGLKGWDYQYVEPLRGIHSRVLWIILCTHSRDFALAVRMPVYFGRTWLPIVWDDSSDPPLPKTLQWVDSFEL